MKKEEKRSYMIRNTFMFASVFETEQFLRKLLRRVLPEIDIGKLEIVPEREADLCR